MTSHTAPTRGFIGDLHRSAITAVRRHKNRAAIAVAVVVLAFLFVSILHPVPGGASETSTEISLPPPANNSYVYKVYTLNHTARMTAGNGTAFLFNTTQLPINFSAIRFGDYRTDAQYKTTYFAGSGILLNSSGANASIALTEGSGKPVSSIFYHGQTIVAFTGQTTTYVNCSGSAMYNGTDRMVQDWREGNWTPNDGIVIEHPTNVTISSAKFYLAVYQPGVSASMPEFELLPAVLFIFLLIGLVRRHKGQ